MIEANIEMYLRRHFQLLESIDKSLRELLSFQKDIKPDELIGEFAQEQIDILNKLVPLK